MGDHLLQGGSVTPEYLIPNKQATPEYIVQGTNCSGLNGPETTSVYFGTAHSGTLRHDLIILHIMDMIMEVYY